MGQLTVGVPDPPPKVGYPRAANCPIMLHLFHGANSNGIAEIGLAEKGTQKGRKELNEEHSMR